MNICDTHPVSVRALGRFGVCVRGEPVRAWRSRKARDLLRILVSRRGRPLAREQLVELLWPDEEADGLAHRLSVALSTVRAVLDPRRDERPDHFVITDRTSMALDTGNVAVDLELFLSEAAHGLHLHGRGEPVAARAALAAAERRYLGDFLEDEPYDDWASSTRESARAEYLRVVRILAELSRDATRTDEAVQYLLKVLDKDRYDERAHQDLVATLAGAGRHGESQRAHSRYLTAMREIGVTPTIHSR